MNTKKKHSSKSLYHDTLKEIEKVFKGNSTKVNKQEQLLHYNQDNDQHILFMLLQREILETKLRGGLAIGLVILMTGQVFAINYVIIKIGLAQLMFENYEPLRWLFTFVITEVIGFVVLILRYLFKNEGTQNLDLISKYIDRMQPSASDTYCDIEEPIDFG